MSMLRRFRRGGDVPKDVRMVLDDQPALYDEAVLAQLKRDNAPHLERLADYAGRLVIVTAPGFHRLDEEETQAIAGSIDEMFYRTTRFTMSKHVGSMAKAELHLDETADNLKQALTEIRGPRAVKPLVTKYVSQAHFGVDMLAQAAARATSSHETAAPLAHIAIVSALGIEAIDLDYPNARGGDAFVLNSVTPEHTVLWDRLYRSRQSARGPHQI